MPVNVHLYNLSELSHVESKDEILLDTNQKTELHIIQDEVSGTTKITFPFGNKFDIIDGTIIIHDKTIK